MGLAMDSAGKFLFVANQGSFDLSEPGSISVFSVNGATLTEIAGSPFLDESVSATQGSGPVALAVNPAGGTLYAANQFTGTVSEFSIDPNSGALTLLSALDQGVGSSPSGLLAVKTSSASFLYVMNTGSNNITAFTINGDGSLTGIDTFPAGTGPVAAATDSGGNYLFVADKNSNQVSQYKISSTTGFLTANSPAAISTGATPVALAVRSGTSGITSTGGTTEFLYVVNMASGTVSIFSFDSTTGVLGQVGSPVSTFGQPSAIAIR
ncbi:MAG: beta-propeller fold lactonase family protein [Acidobacteriales bacterium]|nr:beta-propeller fold lactonase family protein [Terriglobales bacterium]